ncbi:MAG: PAS domain S-box protein [Nitrospirae bacterium]|nr:PAS domain S-box protein [Candidatus Manganitrophaceae bacterium]
MKTPLPGNEADRLETLRRYRILDTPPEALFDDVTLLASQICKTPIALITFLDSSRQWMKASVGLTGSALPREQSFCAHAILGSDPFVVEDASADARFAGNPLVTSSPYIRFYAGVPLVTGRGYALGTLCVADHTARKLYTDQRHALQRLACQVLSHLELRREIGELKRSLLKRKKLYRQLHKTQQRFDLVTRATNDAIWDLNLKTDQIWWNEGAKGLFGDAPDTSEPIGSDENRWYDRIHPDDRLRVTSGIRRAIERREPLWSDEYRLRRNEGYIHVFGRASLIFNGGNEPVRMVGAMMDISRRKKAEAALQQSQQRFRAIFDRAPIGVVCISIERKLMEGNRVFYGLLGYSAEELVNKDFTLLTHPDDIAPDRTLFHELIEGSREAYQIEKRYIRKDGATVWVCKTVSLVRDIQGAPQFAIAMVEDITERKRMETELRETYETLSAVIQASPLAIAIVDLHGKVMGWNPAAERIFGWTEAEVIGRPLPFIPEEKREEFKALAKRVLRGEAFSGFETLLETKESVQIEVSISTGLLRDAHGKVRGVLALIEEITERKEREKAIRQMNEALHQKNSQVEEISQARNRFFSYISHELKTPLNSIIGFTHLILNGNYGEVTSTQSLGLTRILVNAAELVQLINNILDLAKIESGKLKCSVIETDVVDLVERVSFNFRPFIEEKDLSFQIRVAPAFPRLLLIDPAHLRSILSNLLSNAVKFTEEGVIQVELSALPKTRGFHLAVSDTGIGIDPDDLERIFDEFEQSGLIKERPQGYAGGSGLGLAIVKKLVSCMGGRVTADSILGKGTRFVVEISEASL